VHLAHAGHPLVGDDKYGDADLNKALRKQAPATTRLMLHAASLALAHPISKEPLSLKAPLPADFRSFVESHLP
jgi:23S rRNA pseudouridine955/2504/2580 synthase